MNRHRQLIVLYILPLLAVFLALLAHVNYLGTIILFWGIPSLLLTIWAREKSLKTTLLALSATILLMNLDVIFYASKQWYVESTVFPNRLFGLVAWEDFIYFFLFVYFPVIFWEHFFEKQKHERPWGKHMTLLTVTSLLFSFTILAAWIWAPALLRVPYFYLVVVMLFTVIPLVLEIRKRPQFGIKFIRVGLYFGYVAILYELTALYLKIWNYPSTQFVGWIEITGLRFPIEELFAWILLGTATILTWYEYFDDDNR